MERTDKMVTMEMPVKPERKENQERMPNIVLALAEAAKEFMVVLVNMVVVHQAVVALAKDTVDVHKSFLT